MILADEINRAPAKVQSALLEAMQERQVTIGDQTFPLPSPFLVLATQNPIEQEGTYPLPEAQVDRFMLKVKVGYPTREEEKVIMDRMGGDDAPRAPRRSSARSRSPAPARSSTSIYMDEKVKDYILNIVFATREPGKLRPQGAGGLIEFGASPRATIFLAQAARAHAFLRHRGFVTPEDVKAIGFDVLRHRVSLTYEAEAEELTPGEDHPAGLRPRRSALGPRRSRAPQGPHPPHPQAGDPTRKVVSDMLAGQYHSVFKGRGMAFSEVRPVPAGRRDPHHRLERHRAHERAVREGLHRGARADGDAAGRRLGLRGVRLAASAAKAEMAAEVAAQIAFSRHRQQRPGGAASSSPTGWRR